jgi:CPA2 family monovalent cation:H+ antiporter-2
MLAGHALALVGVPMARVIRITRDARDARYRLLRGYFHGADDDTVEELEQAAAAQRDAADGRRAAWASASGTSRCTPWACRWCRCARPRGVGGGARRRARALGAGDTLVLSGLPEALALAEARLLEG